MPKLYSITSKKEPETVPAEGTVNLAVTAIALRQGRSLPLDQKRDCNKLWFFGAFLIIKTIVESEFCLEASLYQSKKTVHLTLGN